MDPATLAHFRKYPDAMIALDGLAARYGQNIEVKVAGPNDIGLAEDAALVRYRDTTRCLAVIWTDGTTELVDPIR